MRIAYLSTFYPFRGGIAQFNASLYREFEKEHEIKAFTFTRQYPEFLFPGKTQYVTTDETADPIEAQKILDTINPITWFRTAKEIKKSRKKINYEAGFSLAFYYQINHSSIVNILSIIYLCQTRVNFILSGFRSYK